MSANPYPVRVSADGDAVIQQETDPRYPHLGPWRSTSGASLSDRQVADWTPYAPQPETGSAVLTASLAEWSAHWPPRTGNDIDETVYGPLAELSADELEKLAHAAGELSRKAWETRAVKLTEEARAAQGITWARVTVDPDGALLFGETISIVTVGNDSARVPGFVENGGTLAGPRLARALRTLGYQPVNLSDGQLDDGVLSFLVRKVSASE